VKLRAESEHLKAIRRGEVSEQEIRKWAADKERCLENLYHKSKLPDKPNETKIKRLLVDCLEYHYGDLSKAVAIPDQYAEALKDIYQVLQRTGVAKT
jgi:hypothetical protein